MNELNEKLKDHILDSIGEGVFTVDKNFRINFFNRAAEQITGFPREEVIGKFCKHVFNSEYCFSDCPLGRVLKTNQNLYDFESTIKNCHGTDKKIKLNAAVLYNDSTEPIGGIVSFRDFSVYEKIGIKLQDQYQFHEIVGHSKQMQEIYELIKDIADSSAPVFIHGESGTGKELVANAIQQSGSRKLHPYIKINCSVFPPNLLASELFGHVKGAFTDAIKDRPGRFELADKGTIFLDEVAEMPLQMQIQLLRVLQEGTFERVGESLTRKTDVRVIASTNINIKEALSKGQFRDDLFYRLNVIPIEVPALRDRIEDVIPLSKHFLNKFSLIYNKQINDFSDSAIEALLSYTYPGNIRELENLIEYAFVRTNSNIIDKNKFPAIIASRKNNFPSDTNYTFSSLSREKTEIIAMLEKHRWNKTKVAEELKIGRTTLWRKLKELNLVK
jgi:PAS domain S-box-containing protein